MSEIPVYLDAEGVPARALWMPAKQALSLRRGDWIGLGSEDDDFVVELVRKLVTVESRKPEVIESITLYGRYMPSRAPA